jgi:prepilin-type N-terminal cleavage/methylation domain-containing protein
MRDGKKSYGFTLIELLIAVALISAVSIGIFYYMQISVRLISKTLDNAKSLQIVRFVTSKITNDIMQSSGAQTGSGPTKLVLSDIQYEYVDQKIKRTAGSDIYNMTVENEIGSFKFSYPSSRYIIIEIIPKNGEKYLISAYARN